MPVTRKYLFSVSSVGLFVGQVRACEAGPGPMSGESQASRPGRMGSSNASLHSQARVWRRKALHVGLMPSRHARGLGLRTRGARGPEQAWELPWDRPRRSQEDAPHLGPEDFTWTDWANSLFSPPAWQKFLTNFHGKTVEGESPLSGTLPCQTMLLPHRFLLTLKREEQPSTRVLFQVNGAPAEAVLSPDTNGFWHHHDSPCGQPRGTPHYR